MTVLINTVLPSIPGMPNINDFIVQDVFAALPYKTGLLGAYFLSNQVGDERANQANLNLPLIRHGTPVLDAKKATCNHMNYYDTQILSQSTMTMITISANATSTNSGPVISNYYKPGATAKGDSIFTYTNLAKFYSGMDSGVAGATVDFGSLSIPAGDLLVSVSINKPGGVSSGVYNNSTNTLLTGNGSGVGRGIQTDKTLLLGTSYSSTEFLGDMGVSVVLIYDHDITGTNTIPVCNYLRNTFGATWHLWS